MSPKLFNVPAEGIFDKASTRNAIRKNRCIIPATGFFLWKSIGKKKQTPYFYYLDQNQVFGIAGIWETEEDLEGKEYQCFLCLTEKRESADWPVLIPSSEFAHWLSDDLKDDQIAELIEKSASIDFANHPVGPSISNERLNTPQLIQPTNPTDQYGNYTLF